MESSLVLASEETKTKEGDNHSSAFTPALMQQVSSAGKGVDGLCKN
jgi:hypothetical protein